MADREEGRRSRTRYSTEIMSKRNNGPVVVYGTVVGVLSVRELAIVDKLRTDGRIRARLVGCPLSLSLCGEQEWFLQILVVCSRYMCCSKQRPLY